MEKSPYYTLHLETFHRSESPEKHFYPKMTQLHHYPSVDFAFLGLLQLEAGQLDRARVLDQKLSRYVSAAYISPPNHDQAISEIVKTDLPDKAGEMRPHLAIRQGHAEIISDSVVKGLKTLGVDNPRAYELPIAHYTAEGQLIDHYNAERRLENAIRFQFRQKYFVAQINQEKVDPANMIPFNGAVTQEFTYTESLSAAVHQLLQVDMSSLNHMIVRNKGLDHLTHSASVFGPYEDPTILELVDFYHSGSGLGLLNHDGVFLKLNEANQKMIAHYVPEIVLLPHGGLSAVRSVARYNSQLTESLPVPALQSVIGAIHDSLGEYERKRLRHTRVQPDGANGKSTKL